MILYGQALLPCHVSVFGFSSFFQLHGSYLLPSKDSGSIGGSRATSMAFAAAAFAEMNGREMCESFLKLLFTHTQKKT